MCPNGKENYKEADKNRIDQSRDQAVLKRRINFLKMLFRFFPGLPAAIFYESFNFPIITKGISRSRGLKILIADFIVVSTLGAFVCLDIIPGPAQESIEFILANNIAAIHGKLVEFTFLFDIRNVFEFTFIFLLHRNLTEHGIIITAPL